MPALHVRADPGESGAGARAQLAGRPHCAPLLLSCRGGRRGGCGHGPSPAVWRSSCWFIYFDFRGTDPHPRASTSASAFSRAHAPAASWDMQRTVSRRGGVGTEETSKLFLHALCLQGCLYAPALPHQFGVVARCVYACVCGFWGSGEGFCAALSA